MPISYFDYFSSLTCYRQTVLVSCFRPHKILYARSAFHYRTVLPTPELATLRLFVVHSALLLSSVYSARICWNSTKYIVYFCHPLYLAYHNFQRQWSVASFDPHTINHCVLSATVSNNFEVVLELPCKYYCISFYLSGYI